MARQAHKPSDDSRMLVKTLAGYGIPQADIGQKLGISKPTLLKYYREELDLGVVDANAKVAENLFKKATGDGSKAVTAAIFWLKTRAGWKDTMTHEHVGEDGAPIKHEHQIAGGVDLTALSDDELMRLSELTQKATDAALDRAGGD